MVDSHKAQMEADRLRAAAPDMLAALDWMLVRFADHAKYDDEDAECIRAAYLARARALGQPTPQGTAAAVAVALGRSPTEPGTARLAADLGE
jgi:hypothetical protein